MGQGQAATASSTLAFARGISGCLSTIVAFFSYCFLLLHIHLIHGDAAQNAPKTTWQAEDDVVGMALKERRPPTHHALVQEMPALLGRAQLRTAQLAYSLFVLAPRTWTDEVGGASHVETDLAFFSFRLHFCIAK